MTQTSSLSRRPSLRIVTNCEPQVWVSCAARRSTPGSTSSRSPLMETSGPSAAKSARRMMSDGSVAAISQRNFASSARAHTHFVSSRSWR